MLSAAQEKMSPEEVRKELADHLEEERRLAHVAVTRAMERLYLTRFRSVGGLGGGAQCLMTGTGLDDLK